MQRKPNLLASRVADYLRARNLTRLWRQQIPEISDRKQFIQQICHDLQLPYKSEKALFDALSRNHKGSLSLTIHFGKRCFWLPEAWEKEQKWRKVEKEGFNAWHKRKRNRDNPYTPGTWEHQAWANGYGDAGDKLFLKIVKKNPSILQGS